MNSLRFDNFFPDRISHGFFGRQGGVSTGLYNSLNCSPQSNDGPEQLNENRERVLNELGGKNLSTLKQIHSSICLPIDNSCTQGSEEGDALVTKKSGQVIACLTADCGPVLFYGEELMGTPVIGVAHAGWGGALKGVLESTISAMVTLGAVHSSIKAAIGPCIGQASYEVNKDFMEQFVQDDKITSSFFMKARNDKLLFNLQGYIQFRLTRAGITQIVMADKDTYTLENDYFSYRRTTHRGEPDYGRQISAISIRST